MLAEISGSERVGMIETFVSCFVMYEAMSRILNESDPDASLLFGETARGWKFATAFLNSLHELNPEMLQTMTDSEFRRVGVILRTGGNDADRESPRQLRGGSTFAS